jgi:hypothetical protein
MPSPARPGGVEMATMVSASCNGYTRGLTDGSVCPTLVGQALSPANQVLLTLVGQADPEGTPPANRFLLTF